MASVVALVSTWASRTYESAVYGLSQDCSVRVSGHVSADDKDADTALWVGDVDERRAFAVQSRISSLPLHSGVRTAEYRQSCRMRCARIRTLSTSVEALAQACSRARSVLPLDTGHVIPCWSVSSDMQEAIAKADTSDCRQPDVAIVGAITPRLQRIAAEITSRGMTAIHADHWCESERARQAVRAKVIVFAAPFHACERSDTWAWYPFVLAGCPSAVVIERGPYTHLDPLARFATLASDVAGACEASLKTPPRRDQPDCTLVLQLRNSAVRGLASLSMPTTMHRTRVLVRACDLHVPEYLDAYALRTPFTVQAYTDPDDLTAILSEMDAATEVAVFFFQAPMQALNNWKGSSWLWNTEQISRKDCRNTALELRGTFPHLRVMDYSPENVHYLRDDCGFEDEIPVVFPPAREFAFPGEWPMPRLKKTHDFCFVGGVTPRRANVIKALRDAGLTGIVLTETEGEDKMSAMAACRVLVNVHQHGDFCVTETIRCYEAIARKVLVLSEPSFHCEDEPLARWMHYCSPGCFVAQCAEMVTNWETLQADAYEGEGAAQLAALASKLDALSLVALRGVVASAHSRLVNPLPTSPTPPPINNGSSVHL